MKRNCAEPIATEPAPSLILPAALVGVNYYPKDKPWHDFWPKLTTHEIEADFDRIKRMGGNAVRIFLQFDAFSDIDRLLRVQSSNLLIFLISPKITA